MSSLLPLARGKQEVYCGELAYIPQNDIRSLMVGGHTNRCFKEKPIPFEACRSLLMSSLNCNALSYYDAMCWLHDRTKTDWVISHRNFDEHMSSYHLFKYIPELDNCTTKQNVLYSTASSRFKKCLLKPSIIDTSRLPLLGIVMSVTTDWLENNPIELSSVISNYKCYSNIHNYTFHLNIMPSMEIGRYWHHRHLIMLHQYLPKYQYVLVVDTDTLIINISKSLNTYIMNKHPPPHHHYDLIFNMREGGEVAASTYFVRNSIYGHCFLLYWSQMSPPIYFQSNYIKSIFNSSNLLTNNEKSLLLSKAEQYNLDYIYFLDPPINNKLNSNQMKWNTGDHVPWISTPNFDNGDLVYVIMSIINQSAALDCASRVKSRANRAIRYDFGMLRCFRVFRGALLQLDNYAPQLKIYFIREGFVRMHLSNPSRSFDQIQYAMKDTYCHSNDILLHGWRAIGSHYWNETERYLRVQNKILLSNQYLKSEKIVMLIIQEFLIANPIRVHNMWCDVRAVTAANSRNMACKWLTYDQEMDIVSKKCYWKSPLCNRSLANSTHKDTVGLIKKTNMSRNKLYKYDNNLCLANHNCNIEKAMLQRWFFCIQHNVCDPNMNQFQHNNLRNKTIYPFDWLKSVPILIEKHHKHRNNKRIKIRIQ